MLKPGQKVRVIANPDGHHGFEIDDIVTFRVFYPAKEHAPEPDWYECWGKINGYEIAQYLYREHFKVIE